MNQLFEFESVKFNQIFSHLKKDLQNIDYTYKIIFEVIKNYENKTNYIVLYILQ